MGSHIMLRVNEPRICKAGQQFVNLIWVSSPGTGWCRVCYGQVGPGHRLVPSLLWTGRSWAQVGAKFVMDRSVLGTGWCQVCYGQVGPGHRLVPCLFCAKCGAPRGCVATLYFFASFDTNCHFK